MKTASSISGLCGLTQQDLAMLLGVSRSQLSMFELGKRDLPLRARKMLADLLKHLKQPATGKNLFELQVERQRQIKDLLRENEYQQLLVAKKITALDKKHQAALRAAQLVEFLQHNDSGTNQLMRVIGAKASRNLTVTAKSVLVKLELKQQLLAQEQELLKDYLRDLGKDGTQQ